MTTEEFCSIPRDFNVRTLDRPAVFKGMIDQWPCRKWTLDVWAQKFKDKKIHFRIGPINLPKDTGPLWETDCNYVQSTITSFKQWQETKDENLLKPVESLKNTSKSLEEFDPKVFWAYADYKHMAELFGQENDIHNCLDWSIFGFDGRKGQDSTIWIGSAHAHTPCHYDTYGCNLVAQLIGRKQWVLFPPSDTENLYPTRKPYEESSVFSRINISQPNTKTFPKFKLTTPYVITLEEGDVLFVPPKWWHFVKSLTTTVSINSWIEMQSDNESRFEEAVTRAVISAYVSMYANEELSWINPTEECTSPELNILYVRETLKQSALQHSQAKVSPSTNKLETNTSPLSASCEESIPPAKIPRCLTPNEKEEILQTAYTDINKMPDNTCISPKSTICPQSECVPVQKQFPFQCHSNITLLESVTYKEFIQKVTLADCLLETDSEDHTPLLVTALNNEQDLKINLLNAIVDPEVVSLICQKLTSIYIQNC